MMVKPATIFKQGQTHDHHLVLNSKHIRNIALLKANTSQHRSVAAYFGNGTMAFPIRGKIA